MTIENGTRAKRGKARFSDLAEQYINQVEALQFATLDHIRAREELYEEYIEQGMSHMPAVTKARHGAFDFEGKVEMQKARVQIAKWRVEIFIAANKVRDDIDQILNSSES